MNSKTIIQIAPLLLAALLWGGCGGDAPKDDHAGHNHGPGEGHGAKKKPEPKDEHAGHNHGPGEGHGAGKPAAAEKCAAHDAPKDRCFICDPALRDKTRLWCKEHGRYEDRCWECHPELQDKKRLFCDEHGLYEDECFICHPEATEPASAGTKPVRLKCSEHGVFEDECAICRPEAARELATGGGLKVRLPAPDSAGMVGVKTAVPTIGTMSESIECLAELAFNQNKLAQIVAPVGGTIQSVDADLGGMVTEGQVVARIWSASIAEAVAKSVLTHQTLDRERKLHADGISSAKDVQEAEAAHRAACQQARTLGFSEEDIDAMGRRPDEVVYIGLRAPFAGEIIERNAVRGSLVESGRPLFTIADRATMWAMLNIPEAQLGRVRTGQTVELSVDGLPGRTFTGRLTWIASQVDERTRMARARAEVANADGVLRDRMFAHARIVTRSAEQAMLIPPEALQRIEGRPMVFVRLEDDLFEARAVSVGARRAGQVEILDGLRADEGVVVASSFALKSQMLVSRLGAGCCED